MSIQSSFISTPTVSLAEGIDLLPSTPSPAEEKATRNKSKLEEKAGNLGIDLSKYTGEPEKSRFGNLVDLAQSSVVRSAGNLYDAGSIVDDKIADYRGVERTAKNPLFDSLSRPEVADQITGADRSGLTQAGKDINAQVEAENYAGAFGTAISNADRYIADSASAPLEFLAGGVVTKLAGGVFKLAGISKAAQAMTKASPKTGVVIDKLAEGLKLPAGASVYAANAVARDVEEYKKNNNNEEPSTEWLATNFGLKTMTGLVQKEILLKGAGKATSSATLGTLKDLAKVIGGKQSAKVLMENMYRNGKVVVGSAFFEAVQEIAEGKTTQAATQTGSLDNFDAQELVDVLGSKKNINQDIVGGITGAATGGALSSVPAAASTSGVAGALATRGVVKATAKTVIKQGTKVADKIAEKSATASFNALPKEDRDAISAKYDAENTVYADLKEATANENAELKKVDTLAKLRAFNNASVQSDLETYKDKLGNPKVVQKIVNRAIAQNNETITGAKVALEAARAKDVTYKVAQRAKELVPEDIREKVDKAVDVAVKVSKDAYGAVISTAQELETSTARAVYDDIGKKKTYSDIGKYLDKNMQDITGKDFDALIELTKSNEKMQSLIKTYKERADKAREHLGIRSTEVVENLDKHKYVANPTADTVAGTHILAKELLDLSNKNFTDPKVLEQVNKAVEAYANSPHSSRQTAKTLRRLFKASDKTGFSVPTDVETLKKQAKAAKKQAKKALKKTGEVVASATKDIVKNTEEVLKEYTYNKADVNTAITNMREGVDLTNADHNYFINRIMNKRAIKKDKLTNPKNKEKSALTPVEAKYKELYPEKLQVAEEAVEALAAKLDETIAKAQPTKTTSDDIQRAGEMGVFADGLIKDIASDTEVDSDKLNEFILYVDMQIAKGEPVSDIAMKAYNLPDIKAYRDQVNTTSNNKSTDIDEKSMDSTLDNTSETEVGINEIQDIMNDNKLRGDC